MPFDGVYPQYTLLFMEPNKDRVRYTASGQPIVNWTFNWEYRPQGWHRIFCRGTGTYLLYGKNSDGSLPYNPADHNDLFQWQP